MSSRRLGGQGGAKRRLDGGGGPKNARRQKVDAEVIPFPVGGWDASSPLAAMPLDRAVELENWFPNLGYGEVRRGWVRWSAQMAGGRPVETLMTYNSQVGTTSKLFAACFDTVYDVTAGDSAVVADTGFQSAQFQWVNLSGPLGTDQALWYCNGLDNPRYTNDGTTFQDAVIDGDLPVGGADRFINVNVHKNRIWLCAENDISAYYLDTFAVSGTATRFPLNAVFSRGGKLLAMGTWTRDGGAGSDDYAVFVSSNGQAAVYQGTDPASDSTWGLVGVFDVPIAIGRRCFTKYGGDLLLTTNEGVYPLGSLLGIDLSQQTRVAITDNVRNAVADAAATYSGNMGWEVVTYPRGTRLLLNIPITGPQSNTGLSTQYVMNTISGAWCSYTKHNANTWVVFEEELYFGDMQGYACKADVGSLDGDETIIAVGQTAYNGYGVPNLKRFVQTRPLLTASGGSSIEVGISTDFVETNTYNLAVVDIPENDQWLGDLNAVRTFPGLGQATWAGPAPVMSISPIIAYPNRAQMFWASAGVPVFDIPLVGIDVTPDTGAATWTGFAPTTEQYLSEVKPSTGEATWAGPMPTILGAQTGTFQDYMDNYSGNMVGVNYTNPGSGAFSGRAKVIDSGTPTNDYDDTPDLEAASLIDWVTPANRGKMITNSSGLLEYTDQNMLVYSENFESLLPSFTSGATVSGNVISVTGVDAYAYRQAGSLMVNDQRYVWKGEITCSATADVGVRITTSSGGEMNADQLVSCTAGVQTTFSIAFTAADNSNPALGLDTRTAEVPGADDLTGETVTLNKLQLYPVPNSGTYLATTGNRRYALPITFDPDNLSAPDGLWVEEERTNILSMSNTFPQLWSISGVTQAQDASGLDVGASGWTVTMDAGAADKWYFQALSRAAVSTASIFAKAGSLSWICLSSDGATIDGVYFDVANGVVGTAATGLTGFIEARANGWFRCIAVNEAGPEAYTTISFHDADGGPSNWNAAGGETMQIAYAQAEDAATASSVIETFTASAIRVADQIELNDKFAEGTSAHTLYTRWTPRGGTVAATLVATVATDSGNNMQIGDDGTTGKLMAFYVGGTGTSSYLDDLGNQVNGQEVKLASAVDATANTHISSFDGNAGSNDTASNTLDFIPPGKIVFGADLNAGRQIDGILKELLYLPTDLAQTELNTLTDWPTRDFAYFSQALEDALTIDFTDDAYLGATGFPGVINVRDSVTPANNVLASPTTLTTDYITWDATPISGKMLERPDGNWEYVAANAIFASNDITIAGWSPAGLQALAPNLMTCSAGSGIHYAWHPSFTGERVRFRMAGEFRAGTNDFGHMSCGDNTGNYITMTFDLTDGSSNIFNGGTSVVLSNQVTPLADSWYRVEFVFYADAAIKYPIIGVCDSITPTLSAAGYPEFTAAGTESVEVNRLQLHPFPGDTRLLVTTGSPRYEAPVRFAAGQPDGIFIEKEKTNECAFSLDLTGTGWSQDARLTLSNQTEADPTGNTEASRITVNTAATVDGTLTNRYTWTATNDEYTGSVWIRSSNITKATLQLSPVATNPVQQVVDITSSWQRFSLTQTLDAGSATWDVLPGEWGQTVSIGDEIDVWHTQLEISPVASTPIITLGATATRVDDELNMVGNFGIGTDNAVFADVEMWSSIAFVYWGLHISPPSGSNYLYLLSNTGQVAQSAWIAAGFATTQWNYAALVTDNRRFNSAASYTAGESIEAWTEGAGGTSGTDKVPTSLNQVRFGYRNKNESSHYTIMRRVLAMPRRLRTFELRDLSDVDY